MNPELLHMHVYVYMCVCVDACVKTHPAYHIVLYIYKYG